jgi:hypothetical protein
MTKCDVSYVSPHAGSCPASAKTTRPCRYQVTTWLSAGHRCVRCLVEPGVNYSTLHRGTALHHGHSKRARTQQQSNSAYSANGNVSFGISSAGQGSLLLGWAECAVQNGQNVQCVIACAFVSRRGSCDCGVRGCHGHGVTAIKLSHNSGRFLYEVLQDVSVSSSLVIGVAAS